MWLLNTARAELKFFPTPESVPGGYAILSHVWDKHEDSFQDIQALRARCAQDGTNPRDRASEKIRNFCVLAQRDGYKWGWDDTCCIDKTSSTDLSEAITAMYRYYSLADVCYAYLRDVPTDCDLDAPESAFRKSRWHRRGWTLQELIAPPFVILLSMTWKPLGSKMDLAPLLEEITRIPQTILRFDRAPLSCSVAERMAWASNRKTTRPEDEAYCLMGLFGIYMPPLYGEGKNAFLRLQEEIVRRLDDPSIFAWGEILDQRDQLGDPQAVNWRLSHDRLFARSPSDFRFGHHVRRSMTYEVKSTKIAGLQIRSNELDRRPMFTITPYALEAYAPIFIPFRDTDITLTVVILWGVELQRPGRPPEHVGVMLLDSPSTDDTRQLYTPLLSSTSKRLFTIPCEHDWRGFTLANSKFQWKTIYIDHAPPTTEPLGLHLLTRSMHTPFHIPRSHIMELLRSPDVVSCELQDNTKNGGRKGTMTLTFTIQPPSSCPLEIITIHMGLCPRASESNPRHWARAKRGGVLDSGGRGTGAEEPEHDCAKHHVDEWWARSDTFKIGLGPSDAPQQLTVRLSFRPYALNPARVRKVRVSLNVHHSSVAERSRS